MSVSMSFGLSDHLSVWMLDLQMSECLSGCPNVCLLPVFCLYVMLNVCVEVCLSV